MRGFQTGPDQFYSDPDNPTRPRGILASVTVALNKSVRFALDNAKR